MSPVSNDVKIPVGLIFGFPGTVLLIHRKKKLAGLKDETTALQDKIARQQKQLEADKVRDDRDVKTRIAEINANNQELQQQLKQAWGEVRRRQAALEAAGEDLQKKAAISEKEINRKNKEIDAELTKAQGLLEVEKQRLEYELKKKFDEQIYIERSEIARLRKEVSAKRAEAEQALNDALLMEEHLKQQFKLKNQKLNEKLRKLKSKGLALYRRKRQEFRLKIIQINCDRDLSLEQVKLERERLENLKTMTLEGLAREKEDFAIQKKEEQAEFYSDLELRINRKWDDAQAQIDAELQSARTVISQEQQSLMDSIIEKEVAGKIRPYIEENERLLGENKYLADRVIISEERYQKTVKPIKPDPSDPLRMAAYRFIEYYEKRNIKINFYSVAPVLDADNTIQLIFYPCNEVAEFNEKKFRKHFPGLMRELKLTALPERLEPCAEGWVIILQFKSQPNLGMGITSPHPAYRQLSKLEYQPSTTTGEEVFGDLNNQRDEEFMMSFRPPDIYFPTEKSTPADEIEMSTAIWYWSWREKATGKPCIQDVNILAHYLYNVPASPAQFDAIAEIARERLRNILRPVGLLTWK